MLEHSVKSSYHSYKIDTNNIIDWLAQTAIRYGYPAADLSTQQVPSTTPTAAHKKKGKKSKKNTKIEYPRTYVIQPKIWPKLAEYIRDITDPSFSVPQIFLYILEHVISTRRKVGLEYEGDKGHAFCLERLQVVYDILLLRRAKDSSVPPDDAFKDIWEQTVNDKGVKKLQARYQSEELSQEEDCFLAGYYLILDILSIRRYISELWKVYAEKCIDLVTVTIVTDYAFALVCELEAEYDAEFPENSTYEDKIMPYVQVQCTLSGMDLWDLEEPEDLFNMKMFKTAEDIMLNTQNSITNFLVMSGQEVGFLKRQFAFGQPREKPVDLTEIPPREQVEHDGFDLCEFMALLGPYMKFDMVWEDQLSAAYRSILGRKPLHLWEILPFQVYLDIRKVLHPDISCAFTDLQSIASTVKKGVAGYERFCDLKRTGWQAETDYLQSILKALDNDMSLPQASQGSSFSNTDISQFLVHHILKNHPFRCGMFALSLRTLLQSYGGSVVNMDSNVSSLCQLYHILRVYNLIENNWPDLDFIIDSHGNKAIFGVETPPMNLAQSFVSIAELVKGGRRRINRPLNPQDTTVITTYFTNRFRAPEKAQKPTDISELINKLLPNLPNEEQVDNKDLTVMVHSDMGMKEVLARLKIWGDVSSIELLANMAIALQVEVRPFCYNYLEIQRQCWLVCSAIQNKYSRKPTKPYGMELDPPDLAMDCVFDRIKEDQPKLGKSIGLFKDAGDCISKHVMNFGDVVVKSLPKEPDLETSKYPLIAV